ncbi:hypothetical protein AAC387_Pa03g0185 [Persea americana]
MHNDQFPKWFESHVRTQERRTRGPNRCIALTNQRERIVIACNEYGQPIGRSERLLSSYVGIIARDGQKTPLTYSDWRRMPAKRKTDMLQAIQAKFDLGNNANTKRWVYLGISTSWRNWKAELKKKYYNPYHTIRERLQHCPARVNPDQWAWLVTFWGSQEGVARSRRNSRNCEAQTMSHTAGTKSFARIRDEARTRNPDGQAPDRIEMFRMTHTRRDGQLVDQASKDVMRQLKESLSQQPESSQNSMTWPGARVRLECRERESMEMTYGIDGMTDQTGTYKNPVPDDHENEICEMVLVSSPQMECATAVHHADRARVALTRNNGIVSDTQYANNLGFLKDEPMVGCSQLLKKYQEYDD